MNILNNAISAIQIGLEDFKSTDNRRANSALRNIFAGILLLFKEKLSRLSPEDSDEVLIKQTILPSFDENKILHFKGKGTKTVDVQQIKERFKEFRIIVDWKVFDEINKLRNNIEHYYTEEPSHVVNEIISKSFKIIRDFCLDYLGEEPIGIFGGASWAIFLETDEIYEAEKSASLNSLSQVNWSFETLKNASEHVRCPSYSSDLIHIGTIKKYEIGERLFLTCKACQNEFDFDEVLEDCISEELEGAAHIAIMDGGDSPYTDCPEC